MFIAPGDKVEQGQTLLVLEAMKMNHEIPATATGVVEKISAVEGSIVAGGETLVEIN